MSRLYNWIVTEIHRDPDRLVFWVIVCLVALAISNGWVRG